MGFSFPLQLYLQVAKVNVLIFDLHFNIPMFMRFLLTWIQLILASVLFISNYTTAHNGITFGGHKSWNKKPTSHHRIIDGWYSYFSWLLTAHSSSLRTKTIILFISRWICIHNFMTLSPAQFIIYDITNNRQHKSASRWHLKVFDLAFEIFEYFFLIRFLHIFCH